MTDRTTNDIVTAHGLGWRPDLPDPRDFRWSAPADLTLKLPARFDIGRRWLPPIWDQGNIGSCFPAGTLIRLADGAEKPIEEMRLLDRVVTAEGNVGDVQAALVRWHDEDLVRIRTWGHNHLRLTAEHPVLTRRGYVPAGELQHTDYIKIVGWMPDRAAAGLATAPHVRVREQRLKVGWREYNSVRGGAERRFVHELPEKVTLTSGFGRLVGLFLAEGSCSAGKAIWTFGSHERDTLVAETARLIRAEFDIEATIQPRPNNSTNVIARVGEAAG